MNFLNIGLPELLVLGLILLIVFGPERLPEEARKTARWIRSIMRTETYREAAAVVKAVRELPRKVMQEAQIEELEKEITAFERNASAPVSLMSQPSSGAQPIADDHPQDSAKAQP